MDPRQCLSGTIPKEKEKENGKVKAREKAKAKTKTSHVLDPTTGGTTRAGTTVGMTTVGAMIDEAKEAASPNRRDPSNQRRHGVRIISRASATKALNAGTFTSNKLKLIR